MKEQRELLAIDPESVKWGRYSNYGGGIAYAKGWGQYEGIIFIHTGNVGNLETTRQYVKSMGSGFVVGVGIDRIKSGYHHKVVYDHRSPGVWRTPFWELETDMLELFNMKPEDIHPVNRTKWVRTIIAGKYEAMRYG